MKTSIAFRSICQEDERFLFRLYASTREKELAQVEWSTVEKENFLLRQFKAQHSFYRENFGDAAFDIILEKEEPIGRLYVDRRADEIRIIDIALLPEYRGKEVGSKLIRDLLDEAEQEGMPVRIHVERFNPALRLYRRLGFEVIEDKGVYYLMEWMPPVTLESSD